MGAGSSLYKEDRDSIFLSIFGKSPQTRVIDLFLDNPLFDLSKNEIIESLGMAKVTLYKTLPLIESSGIIVPSRKIGRAQLYKLNNESITVRNLRSIIRDASTQIAENELLEEELLMESSEEKEILIA
jgi:Fe2+ or Zn2+ uptake regulation protein